MEIRNFSEPELRALINVNAGILITQIPAKSEKDCLGTIKPGMAIYGRLIREGLIFFTEEDDSEFDWTPQVEFTEAGAAVCQHIEKLGLV